MQRYTAGLDLDGLLADERTYDVVLRNLEIIGEAAKSIPMDVRAGAPTIDWRGMAGLRDILAHAYFSINENLLREIITTKVPELEAAMNAVRLTPNGGLEAGKKIARLGRVVRAHLDDLAVRENFLPSILAEPALPPAVSVVLSPVIRPAEIGVYAAVGKRDRVEVGADPCEAERVPDDGEP